MSGATTVLSDQAAELSSAAWLLARWWSRPEPEERAVWEGAWEDARAIGASIGVDPALVEELERAAGETGPEPLLEEHERLFVGPGQAPCAPYEALWRSDAPRRERGTLMGSATTAVAGLYRRLELAVREDPRELPDHVAVECEALAHALGLASAESVELARELLDEHLAAWLPRLCEALENEAGDPFHLALARLTPPWTEALAASLR